MSSMPGFPIIVFWDEPENYEDEVKLTCSQGELIKWNQKTGKTKDLGKTHAYKKMRIFIGHRWKVSQLRIALQ